MQSLDYRGRTGSRGWEREDLMGHVVLRLVSPGRLDSIRQHWAQARKRPERDPSPLHRDLSGLASRFSSLTSSEVARVHSAVHGDESYA